MKKQFAYFFLIYSAMVLYSCYSPAKKSEETVSKDSIESTMKDSLAAAPDMGSIAKDTTMSGSESFIVPSTSTESKEPVSKASVGSMMKDSYAAPPHMKSMVRDSIKAAPEYFIVPVYYGTDRQLTRSSDINNYYGPNENKSLSDTGYQTGVVKISIPFSHTVGKIESPPWWKPCNRSNPNKYMIIEGIDTLPGALFLEELRDIVASSDEKEEFIFIHGFNSSFTDAAKRTAQLAHDIGFKGVPIFYSWPSRGKATPFAYTADEDAVQWTVPHFKSFLYNVIKQTGAKKVHLVCHSMGIRALGNVMQSIQQDFKDVVFDQIIIAAPDISVDIFKRDIAQHFRGVAKRMTIYVSANDRALRLSRNIHHDIRLGEIDNIIRGFETVDATNLKSSDFFDHAYFDQSRPVLTDISLLFQRNIPPTDTARNLTEMGIVNGNYWIFKR